MINTSLTLPTRWLFCQNARQHRCLCDPPPNLDSHRYFPSIFRASFTKYPASSLLTSYIIYMHNLKQPFLLYLIVFALISSLRAWMTHPIHPALLKSYNHHPKQYPYIVEAYRKRPRKVFGARFPPSDPDLSPPNTPRPKIISPKRGTHPELEKFMMMYTCKVRLSYGHQALWLVSYIWSS